MSSNDRNLALKVTFGETERRVKIQDEDERSKGRQRQQSGGGQLLFFLNTRKYLS